MASSKNTYSVEGELNFLSPNIQQNDGAHKGADSPIASANKSCRTPHSSFPIVSPSNLSGTNPKPAVEETAAACRSLTTDKIRERLQAMYDELQADKARARAEWLAMKGEAPTELELIEREIKRLQITAALLYRGSWSVDAEMAEEMRQAAIWVGERAWNLSHLPEVKEARDLRLDRNIRELGYSGAW